MKEQLLRVFFIPSDLFILGLAKYVFKVAETYVLNTFFYYIMLSPCPKFHASPLQVIAYKKHFKQSNFRKESLHINFKLFNSIIVLCTFFQGNWPIILWKLIFYVIKSMFQDFNGGHLDFSLFILSISYTFNMNMFIFG